MKREEETIKNCTSLAMLPVRGTPLDALPFDQRAAQLRAMLKLQMDADMYHAIYNILGAVYRGRMKKATDYQEELKKPARFATISNDTFWLDYFGSMHKTGYSDQITDVRFLGAPEEGNTLHLNVIENDGEFRIACLANNDVSVITNELEQVMKDHDPPVRSIPVRSFTLPNTAWREGLL